GRGPLFVQKLALELPILCDEAIALLKLALKSPVQLPRDAAVANHGLDVAKHVGEVAARVDELLHARRRAFVLVGEGGVDVLAFGDDRGDLEADAEAHGGDGGPASGCGLELGTLERPLSWVRSQSYTDNADR